MSRAGCIHTMKKLFQIVYKPDGTVDSCQEMPPEPEKKRVLFIREVSAAKATALAAALFSLAK